MHSDQEIISGIQNNHDWAIALIYKTHYQPIRKMIYTFRNTILDPEDIFQEGLTRVILNVRAGKFRGDSSIATYLNSICRNICLKILSKTTTELLHAAHNPGLPEAEEDHHYELLAFINRLKSQLGEHCQEVLDLRFATDAEADPGSHKLLSFDEIAQKLEITVENARQRFKRCLDQLRKQVFEHPEYENLFD